MSDEGARTKELSNAYLAEFHGLRNGVANATLAWSAVENAMVQLLTAVLNRDNMGIPAAMYFALSGIESRLTMVSDGFMELLFELKRQELEIKPEKPYVDRLGGLWRKMIKGLRELKQTRNHIAHGQIVGVDTIEFAPNSYFSFPRLTSPAFNFSRFREAREKGMSPGMSAKEIQDHSTAVEHASNVVQEFEDCVRLIHAGDTEALLEKLPQLEAELRRQGGQDSQTSAKQPSQLRPSPVKLSQAERRDAVMYRADLKTVRSRLIWLLAFRGS